MIRFRHYHDKFTMANPSWGLNFWGHSIRKPTLDIMLGKHIFVIFWDNAR
jgi:hypothetical protein